MVYRNILIALTVICLAFSVACGPKAAKPQSELDTPEHHVKNGNKLLKMERIDDAISAFTRARELDPKFGPAYLGLGIANGYQKHFDEAFDNLKMARKYADGDDQRFDVHIGTMRVYLMGKNAVDEDWLDEIKDEYDDALELFEDRPAAYYYMGLAYKDSYMFRKAVGEFTYVLDLKKGFMEEADREYALVQKIERAMPGSDIGKKIALLPEITRADLAALFIEELGVDDLYRRKAKRTFDTGFKSPEEIAAASGKAAMPASDIADHVLKIDIMAVIDLGIKGLQPFADGTFRPDEKTTRAEFAMIVEDILIKITGEQQMATRFIGNASPFPDLRNDLPYFNAVMVCTTRGIMEAKDLGTGAFDPAGTISGADALLSIRALKNQLSKY